LPGFAIAYRPEAFDIQREQIFGRRVANDGFLKAFARSGENAIVYGYCDNQLDYEHMSAKLSASSPISRTVFIPRSVPEGLAVPGALFWSAPDISLETRRRAVCNSTGWSLIGLTHSLAGTDTLSAIESYLIEPVQEFDALVCTSLAARKAVETILEEKADYLSHRLGMRPKYLLQLPIIPLGVDVNQFKPDESKRQTTRTKLGLRETDVAILLAGRFDERTKGHHLPILMAVAKAAEGKSNIHIVMAGWFADVETASRLVNLASAIIPDVQIHIVENPTETNKVNTFLACDIFLSLPDNIQETFGLTVIEAMAAGLPCVVSDWSGYRDLVRDGETGFLCRSTIPPPSLGNTIADLKTSQILSYPSYLEEVAHRTIISVGDAAYALALLVSSTDKRKKMGDAARADAQRRFSWDVVMREYRALSAELEQIRRVAKPLSVQPSSPFSHFRCFATGVLSGEAIIVPLLPLEKARVVMELAAQSADGNLSAMTALEVFNCIISNPVVTLNGLFLLFDQNNPGKITLAVAQLAKMGIIEFNTP
jgi:alpha-maltose-1-phosphate synthase